MSAPLSIVIDVQYAQVAGILASIDAAMDTDWIVAEASSIILNHTRARFLEERDPDGQQWVPSEAGITRRAGGHTYRNGKTYSGTGTLFETGTLFHSIQDPEGEFGGDSGQGNLFNTLSERRIVAGALNEKGEEYGHKFQYGTDGMIQRRFLGINDGDVELFEARLLQRCSEAMGL